MENTEQVSEGHVVIPPQTVADSEEKKRKGRTLRQMPVYRDLSELKYQVVLLQSKCPRKLTKFFDQMLTTVEERFISQGNVSFNCRKGFGTQKAIGHVAEGMRRVSDNYRKPAWVFKGDLVGFFMSIDKELLWYLLERFIVRWQKRFEREGWEKLRKVPSFMVFGMPRMYWDILLSAVRTVVMHRPEKDCVLNSPVEWWNNIPCEKSLFTSPTGEPIGNLTTQQFANFLMSFFVSRVQWLFRRSGYTVAQFVDDFVIVCDDLGLLKDNIVKLESFLSDSLRLKLHKDKRYIQPVSHGLLFVGSFVKPGRVYLSNRTKARMKERCVGFGRKLEEAEVSRLDLTRIEQVLNSYLGFCKDRNTYGFRKDCIASMGRGFWRYFYVKGHYDSIRAKKKYLLTA